MHPDFKSKGLKQPLHFPERTAPYLQNQAGFTPPQYRPLKVAVSLSKVSTTATKQDSLQ